MEFKNENRQQEFLAHAKGAFSYMLTAFLLGQNEPAKEAVISSLMERQERTPNR